MHFVDMLCCFLEKGIAAMIPSCYTRLLQTSLFTSKLADYFQPTMQSLLGHGPGYNGFQWHEVYDSFGAGRANQMMGTANWQSPRA